MLNVCCEKLDIHRYYTAGVQEVRSWFIPHGATAAQAAGKIHGDFEKNFICAEISKVQDWVDAGCEEKVVSKRFGKDYVMQANDVMEVKHNAK